MILLNPEIVRFENLAWEDVIALAIDRTPKRTIEDHSDEGPFPAFADVPEQSITIKLQRRITQDDTEDPTLGESGTLTFYTGPAANDAARRKVSITCVATSIRCDLPSSGKPAIKTITFAAASTDGSDPVAISAAALEA